MFAAAGTSSFPDAKVFVHKYLRRTHAVVIMICLRHDDLSFLSTPDANRCRGSERGRKSWATHPLGLIIVLRVLLRVFPLIPFLFRVSIFASSSLADAQQT